MAEKNSSPPCSSRSLNTSFAGTLNRYSDFKRCDRVYQDIKYIFSIFDHPDVQAGPFKEDRKEELERLVLTIERRLYTSESKLTSAIASVQNFNRGVVLVD